MSISFILYLDIWYF